MSEREALWRLVAIAVGETEFRAGKYWLRFKTVLITDGDPIAAGERRERVDPFKEKQDSLVWGFFITDDGNEVEVI